MNKKISLVFVASLCISAAQTSQQATFQASTRLTLIPVVVRDRDGKVVTDLGQDSFQLFDNGKPQPITSFAIERGAAAGQTPEQFTTFFFDDVSLNDISAVASLRDAALHNLADLQPGDRVAIFSSSCRLAQDFTDDRVKLAQVVSKFQPAPISACQVAPTLPLQIALLQALVRRMSVLPGTRGIVVVSAGFRVQAERQAMTDQLIDEAIRGKVAIQALHYSGNYGQDIRAAMDRQTLGPQQDQSKDPSSGPIDPANLFAIAEGTGGTVIEATNSAQAALRQVATPTCIYILGLAPEGKADGKYHKLKVKLKDPRKLSVRAREGYFSTAASVVDTPPSLPAAPSETAAAQPSPVVEARPAQVPPAVEPQERSTIKEPVMFSSRTSLVLVQVVVRDRDGHAVGNLQKSNFELWDGRNRQEITNFNEEKSERVSLPHPIGPPATTPDRPLAGNAPAAVIPETFLAYVFDDVHMRFGDMEQVRRAVWQNIVDTFGPADRIAVVTTSGRVMLDFTDDREKIHQALYRIQPTAVFRTVCGLRTPPAACADKLSFMHAYKISTGDREALWKGVPLVTGASISGAIGRNSPSDTPLEMRTEAAANGPLAAGERETELSLHTLRDLARKMASLAGRRSIVLVSHGFLVTGTEQDDLANTIDRAIRSEVVIHTLNSSGLRSGAEEESPWDDDTVGPVGGSPYTREAQIAGAMTLEVLAEGTGGTAIENSNDYLSAVRRLAAPPEYRYVLGFAPQDLVANGSFHGLTIKLANIDRKGYTIQARRGYYAPKRGEGLTEAAAKEIENAVFTLDESRDLPVGLRTELSHPEGRSAELAVLVDVDLKFLHFRPADGRNRDDVTVVAAVFDHNGNFIEGKQVMLKLRLLDETLAALEQQPPETLKIIFDLSPGAYLVRLVVRSAEGQSMAAASRTIEVP